LATSLYSQCDFRLPETSCTEQSHPWYALRVKTRLEQTAVSLLSAKGYECFSPESRVPSGSVSRSAHPALFPGYVFCRFDVLKRLPILVTPTVIDVVSLGRIPCPLEEDEIVSIQEAVRRNLYLSPWESVCSGSPVRIAAGPMAGLFGTLVTVKDRDRLIVSIGLLGRSVSIEFENQNVELDRKSKQKVTFMPPMHM
jgi:transcription termination/antitermination protein NusG